jgi:hypothetical protein
VLGGWLRMTLLLGAMALEVDDSVILDGWRRGVVGGSGLKGRLAYLRVESDVNSRRWNR